MFITIAQATPPPPPAAGLLAMMFPILFLGAILGIILAVMAPRKGGNPFLWFIIGLIPFVGAFAALVLASRPDISLLKRLRALEEMLPKSNPIPPPSPMTGVPDAHR